MASQPVFGMRSTRTRTRSPLRTIPTRIGGILGLVEDVQPIHLDLRLDSSSSRQPGKIRRQRSASETIRADPEGDWSAVRPAPRSGGWPTRRFARPRRRTPRATPRSRGVRRGPRQEIIGRADSRAARRFRDRRPRPAPSRPGGKAHEPHAIHRSISRLILRRADFVKGNRGPRHRQLSSCVKGTCSVWAGPMVGAGTAHRGTFRFRAPEGCRLLGGLFSIPLAEYYNGSLTHRLRMVFEMPRTLACRGSCQVRVVRRGLPS